MQLLSSLLKLNANCFYNLHFYLQKLTKKTHAEYFSLKCIFRASFYKRSVLREAPSALSPYTILILFTYDCGIAITRHSVQIKNDIIVVSFFISAYKISLYLMHIVLIIIVSLIINHIVRRATSPSRV